ncbi:dermatopontin [Biomphalaria pfeifferi]|uniref:Dermatopontin n=1 Tax=Biomphalaria pfeifferi TaxID=112525 RepID=A0AAD8B0Z5_BIOPF|nr:dermatopontin [Biomphalaria pfeifferi]
MRILYIAFVTLAIASGTLAGYINAFDQPFAFNCPAKKIISYISSVHDNYYEDRRWEIHCRTSGSTSGCVNSGDYVNNFDNPVFFLCPGNKVLTGIESYHHDYYEDRRFKFQCCDVTERIPSNCYTTANMNEWDGKLTMLVPDDQAIVGVFSHHNDYYEDRLFSFRLCTL